MSDPYSRVRDQTERDMHGFYALQNQLASQGYNPHGYPPPSKPQPQQGPLPPFNWQEFVETMYQKWLNQRTPDENGYYEFDFDALPLRKFIVVLGPRETGKSVLVYYMLFRMRNKIPVCVVFSGSDDDDSFVRGILPDCFVNSEIDMDVLNRVRDRFEGIRDTKRATGRLPPFCTSDDVLLIGDDILDDQAKLKHKTFKKTVMQGRHDGEGLWLLVQYDPDFPKNLRKQPDFIFIQRHETEEDVQRIWKTFASGIVRDFNEFYRLVNFYTENYGTLILRLKPLKGVNPNDLTHRIYYCRALPKHKLPPFKLDAGTMFPMARQHERVNEHKGKILDYDRPDITDYRKALGNSAATDVGSKRNKKTPAPIFRMPR